MRRKVMSAFICAMIMTSISVSITQNAGQPQNIGQPTSSSSGTGGLADSPWPMFMQNPQHTGLSPYDTSGNNGQLKWSYTTGGTIKTSPAISSDGTIYVGSNDGKLYAIGLNAAPNITVEKTANVAVAAPGDPVIYTAYYNNTSETTSENSNGNNKEEQLTFTTGHKYTPSYSPDGNKILYIADEPSAKHIWIMNADGSNMQQLTSENGVHRDHPSFSPDGEKIVFIRPISGKRQVWTMNADGSDLQQLTFIEVHKYTPSYSPDGNKIIFHAQEPIGTGYHIWIMNADGSNLQQLTSENGVFLDPKFSPDGEKIVFIRPISGKRQVWTMNADGSDLQQLTFTTGHKYTPSYSPDGNKILYIADEPTAKHIWIMNADGSNMQQLTSENGVHRDHPSFSPDGEKIVFIRNIGGKRQVWVFNYTSPFENIAQNVWINDTLPIGTTFITSSAEADRTGDYNWTFYGVGPGEHNFTITVQVNAGVPNGTILTNYVHLDCTDHRGNPMPSSFDSVDVIVIAEDYTPPVADAGLDQTVNEGDIVQFNGSNSYDPDGTIETYEWDFDASDGLWWETGATQDATSPTATHIYGDDGVFVATLRVTDNDNLSASDTCNVTVLNVDPTAIIESITMDVEIGLRVAGRKYNNVSMALYEDGNPLGYVSIERLPGSPDEQMAWIPVSINFSKSYNATVIYTPEDPSNIGGNPVWIYIKSQNGNINKIHHTFNVQQSKNRDSDHWNHIEPWEVDLNGHFVGLPFEITSHITDPGSDDKILTYTYGSQVKTVTYMNNPPNPDPYPSPEVNPRDIINTIILTYEGPGTLMLTVEDGDGGFCVVTLDIS